jgi:G:T/U-mismatch repair DNA glycosylase
VLEYPEIGWFDSASRYTKKKSRAEMAGEKLGEAINNNSFEMLMEAISDITELMYNKRTKENFYKGLRSKLPSHG